MRESDLIKGIPEVYVDMDGVLSDLFNEASSRAKVKNWIGLTQQQWDEWYRGADAEELFGNLQPFPTTDAVIDMVTQMFGHYRILSRPLQFAPLACIRGKNKWLDTHIKKQPLERIFTPDKWKYATQTDGTPNILIDDHRQNIHLWEEHGGIGIKWQADENSLAELKHALVRAKDKFQ